MLKEIYEQIDVAKKILAYYRGQSSAKAVFEGVKQIVFLGSGSSYNAALWGNYCFEECAGLSSKAEVSDEFANREAVVPDNTLAVVLSQSGRTGSALKAAEKAKQKGARVLSVTNDAQSPLAGISDFHIELLAGEEKAVAATKTFLSQILHLFLLANIAGNKSGDWSKQILSAITGALDKEDEVKEMARDLKNDKKLTVLGSVFNLPLALEAAQKINETCYVQAGAMNAPEFRHGPKAVIEKNYPAVMITSSDSRQTDEPVAGEISALGAKVFAVSNYAIDAEKSIILEQEEPAVYFGLITVVQLLSYHISLAKKINPDNLRNIEKFIEK